MMRLLCAVFAATVCTAAAERAVDPTWLYRSAEAAAEQPSDVTTPSCHYKPLFGAGDPEARIAKGVARYGVMVVDPNGTCATVNYPAEEQVYVILTGSGTVTCGLVQSPVRKHDFMYLPPGMPHAVSNTSSEPMRLIVMGFRIPPETKVSSPGKFQSANIDDVKLQTVGGHPPTTLYRLLMGDTTSTRDRVAAGHILTSLFIMEFAPGGTNFPHHHETEEEIYLLLDGTGKIVAGAGMNGVEGRHPAKPGDAYFFRLNCTVGFYASTEPGTKARILAVRSRFPFPKRP